MLSVPSRVRSPLTASKRVALGAANATSTNAPGASVNAPTLNDEPLVSASLPPSLTVTAAPTLPAAPVPVSVPPDATFKTLVPRLPTTSSVPALTCVLPPIALLPSKRTVPVPTLSRLPPPPRLPAKSPPPNCSVAPVAVSTPPAPLSALIRPPLARFNSAPAATSTVLALPNEAEVLATTVPAWIASGPV